MIQRFQIEDLIAQDNSGVVFRAVDMETDAVVAVRRLFPFGVDGGGLNEEEQTAYNIAVGRLVGLNHPAMRAVISGGCDPIDGMPYIANEWIQGKPLATFIESQPLKPTEAINVITCALEVSELLSRVLAEEGIWVETDLRNIVVGDDGTGRGVTFWIAPLKWLSRNEEPGTLDSIIVLTEEIMGWKGQTVGDNAGRGLGGWLKWLQRASKTTTLAEAREMLAASTGMEPPTPSKQLVRQAASRPSVPIKAVKPRKKSINGMLVTIVLLCLIAGGLVGWAIYRKDPHEPKATIGLAELAAQMASENAENTPANSMPDPAMDTKLRETAAAMKESEKAAELLEAKKVPVAAPKPAPKPAPPPKVEAKKPQPQPPTAKVVFAHDNPALLKQDKHEVTVEGILQDFGLSQSENSLFLLFSKQEVKNGTRGSILIREGGPDLTKEALKNLIGKKIQVTGKLEVQDPKGLRRPDILIKNRAAIKEIDKIK